MATEIVMPPMGEGIIEGTVGKWLKQEGDQVDQYEPVLEIETDKVTTEATVEEAGVLLKILVPAGETVPVGTILAYLGQPGELVPKGSTATGSPEAVAQEAAPAEAARAARPTESPSESREMPPAAARISPVVARIAAEHGVDLAQVTGTGRDGRITKKDMLAYVAAREDEQARSDQRPAVADDAAEATPLMTRPLAADLVPHSSMRRSIAEHMVRSKQISPHVTTVFEVDFSQVVAHRRAHREAFARDGANLTFTPYLIHAVVHALKGHPRVNSEWREEGLLLHREINIGMATAIEGGLIVPVIKEADGYNLLGLTRVVNELATRARQKRLTPADVQGGTFSLTNHGTSGSLFATPIINQPQCGILGVGAIEKRVKVIDDAIAIRPLAYASFTFDHRILDGASADRFVSSFKRVIETWR